MKWFAAFFSLLLLTAGDLAQSQDISKAIESRTGHKLNQASKSASFALPEGVSLDDGLSEDEAVAIALWNNPALQAELAALGLARADVIEAGQLRNPNLTMIFPFSSRVLEAVANWPFDTLWQRPRRVAAAKLELNRTEENLTAMALDLVRDVRLTYADSLLAEYRSRIAVQATRERDEIAVIVNAQFRAGEISELETNAARLDASLAEEQSARFRQESVLAGIRLRSILGFANDAQPFALAPLPAAPSPTIIQTTNVTASSSDPLNDLIKQAFDARPELKAAELAIEAAGQRAKWERSKILAVSAIAKEYGKGANRFEQGPGLQIDLPIFNRNKGAISRAEADIERAAKHLAATRHRVALEVQQAYTQLEQERQSLERWRTTVQPQMQEQLRRTERTYAAGDVAYLLVLQTAQRLTDARLREVELLAAQSRAAANLERSIGRRLIANR